MAIQQVVPIIINLQGDGTSTVFKYALSSLFAINTESHILYAANVPTNITASSTFGIPVTATMNGGKIQLTFASAPVSGQQAQVTINLLFSSQ